jgi:DNA-binding XRE family transcriptional regulator
MTPKERKSLYSIVGNNIRAIRERNSIKQGALAEMLNLSRASIVNIEKGRQQPSLHLLIEIAQALNVEFLELLSNINLGLSKGTPLTDTHSLKFGALYNSKSQREAEKHVKRFLSTIYFKSDDNQKN